MPPVQERDTRDEVDTLVHGHQVNYSLQQLRLVGVLLLLIVLGQVLVVLILSAHGDPRQRLTALSALATWLPLLPLGTSLYLLAGGRRRHHREHLFIDLVNHSLIPLALTCLFVLPVLVVTDVANLTWHHRAAEVRHARLIKQHQDWLATADQAPSAAKVNQLATLHQLKVPIASDDSVELARWRLAQALDHNANRAKAADPLLNLTPYQLDLLAPWKTATTLVLTTIAGLGLVLLDRQGRRQLRRHGLTPALFFRSDSTGKRQRLHRSRTSLSNG